MKSLIWGFRERESFKPAFTLVEMLIVVVLIGILGAAILPRFSGYLERTRDLKRQADLRNIAAAVERYKDEKGHLPFRKDTIVIPKGYSYYFGSAGDIQGIVPNYISKIPQDPSKSSMIKVHARPTFIKSEYWKNVWRGDNRAGGEALQPGQYLYQFTRKGSTPYGGAVLVAKVETPDAANLVLNSNLDFNKRRRQHAIDTLYTEGGLWGEVLRSHRGRWEIPMLDIEQINLCEKVEKSKTDAIITATKTNKNCQYVSEDELYYIVKIE